MNSEVGIKKYPYLSYSHNLIENFSIIGINNIKKNEIKNNISQIIKQGKQNENIIKIEHDNSNFTLYKYNISVKPTIINSISSDFNGNYMIDSDLLIEYTFPKNPLIYYYIKEKNTSDEIISNYIKSLEYNLPFFTNCDIKINNKDTKNPLVGFSYIFYEQKLMTENIRVFFPKSFLIISQYLYFMKMNELFHTSLKLFLSDSQEIPLEILLYNIVNFVPSPINFSYSINFFPEKELSLYLKNNNEEIINKEAEIEQMSAYPICDYAFKEIFKFVSSNIFIKLFLYTFIERYIIIFSKDIKKLNMLMIIIFTLSYPFTETSYFNQIITVDEGDLDLIDKPKSIIGKLEPHMIGINCTYNEKYNNKIKGFYFQGFIILDLDDNIFYFDGKKKNTKIKDKKYDDLHTFNEDEFTDIQKLDNYFDKILLNKKIENLNFFGEGIKMIQNHLQYIKDKIEEENSDNINFFDQEAKLFSDNRITFQEPFYFFTTTIFCIFRKAFSFEKIIEEKNNIKVNKYILKYDENKLNDLYIEEELIFINCLKETPKYNRFVKEYLLKFESQEIYKIPYIFCEYFIFMRYNNCSVEKCFDIMKNLYFQKELNLNLNFEKFYVYYFKNLKKYFFNEIKLSKQISSNSKLSDKKLTYKYNSIELDNNILLNYSNYIENLSREELEEIFFLNCDCKIKTINYNDILREMINMFVGLKKIKYYNFLGMTGLLILGYYCDKFDITNKITFYLDKLKNDYDNDNINEKQLFFPREYISILLSLIYKLCLKKEISFEYKNTLLNIYNELMEFIISNSIFPNENILKLVNSFINIQIEVKKYLIEKQTNKNEETKFEEEEEEEKKSEEKKYKIFLKYNFCQDGVKNEEFYIKFSQSMGTQLNIINSCEYCKEKIQDIYNLCDECCGKTIQLTKACNNCNLKVNTIVLGCEKCKIELKPVNYFCVDCQKEIKPKIFLRNNVTKKTFNVPIYTPMAIFKIVNYFFNQYLITLEKDINDKMKECIINLIFYHEYLPYFNQREIIEFLLQLLD